MELSQWMAAEGVSGMDLARRLGVSGPTVSRILSGKLRPSVALALKIVRETGGAVPIGTLSPTAAALVELAGAPAGGE